MKKSLIVILLAGLVLSGCATTGTSGGSTSRAKKKARTGALIGGLLGAARAAVTGGDSEEVLKQAAVGAAAGAAIGYAIGRVQDRRLAGRDQAAARYAYHSSQGDFLAFESLSVEPATLAPGSDAVVTVVYTVLSPAPGATLSVNHSNALFYDGEPLVDLGTETLSVDGGGGTMELTYPVSIPANAPAGTYSLASSLSVVGTNAQGAGSATIHVTS